MRCYKLIEDGYLTEIGRGNGGEEITQEEFDGLFSLIQARPDAAEGKYYRLKENLTWEECDLPPVEEAEEISAEEALNIILEGETL